MYLEPRGLGFKSLYPEFVLIKRKIQKLYEWGAHSRNLYDDVRNAMIVMDAHSLARSNRKARILFSSWVLSSVQKMWFPVGLGKDQLLSPPCWHFALHNYWQREINRKVILPFFWFYENKFRELIASNIWSKVTPPAPPDLAVVSSMSFGSITTSTSSA